MTTKIPEPTAYPIIGHAGHIDLSFPLGSFMDIADKYGEIYRMRLPGANNVVVTTQALVNEVCDEKRFKKSIISPLKDIRRAVHNGLFTAHNEEEPWGIAHRVLMPAFGPLNIRDMYSEMHDVATQLALKWARGGPEASIMVTDDFTRLTLDTIALCSMGYRFNSFYSDDMHEFVGAMADLLIQCDEMDKRVLPKIFYQAREKQLEKDIEIMRKTAQKVLSARQNGLNEDHIDLLTAMMKGVDPKTGKKMTDESIIDNLITFLIAGHETTSGMLSYAFYQLLKNPETFAKAQQEVDSVCGKGPITVDQLSKLPYINAVLRETLRLSATIPIIALEAKEDTTLGGKYFLNKGQAILAMIGKSHLDPAVYGSDVKEFKPERMLDENFNRLNKEFPNCWKPFGNGMRSCIGRPFAWQEALLVMAMLLQNFNFILAPGYTLSHKQTLTVKPNNLTMRAILRDGLTPKTLERRLAGSLPETNDPKVESEVKADEGKGIPMTILYGSNSGTCKSLAQQVASNAPAHGFQTMKLDCLDSAKDSLPTDHPVVIVTASFEGEPPDNAQHFVSWIQSLEKENKEKPLKNVSYAVFGCGHSDWVGTYQRIPRLVNSTMADLGAHSLAPLGETNVSTGATFTDFEAWEDNLLWPALVEKYGSESVSEDNKPQGVNVTVSNPRNSTLKQELEPAMVVKAKTLTAPGEENSVKKHLEIKLPTGMKYQTGDYLTVLPINPKETIQRAMKILGLSWDAHLEITSDIPVALPVDKSVLASEVLGMYVELSQPATKKNLLKLAEFTTDEEISGSLIHLANDAYTDEITSKHISVLDILERFPTLRIPIGIFLTMLPPMRVRQYSISSSALDNPSHVSITYSIVRGPSYSGKGFHVGVATSYLSSLQEGDTLHVAIRASSQAFSLPSDPEHTPLVCIGAGSGIAPFRGFIQERANMIAAGRTLAPAVLYYGCRSPDVDDLYREEMDEWEKLGAVDVRRTFSRNAGESLGCKYVQDRAWHDKEELVEMWKKGAKVFVCGSKAVGESVKDVMIKIHKGMEGEEDKERLQEWFQSQRNVRYVADIYD